MEKSELEELAQSIRDNGFKGRITLLDGKILDGRNRWRAAKLAGVEPPTVEYKGSDPLALVIMANLRRRHLNESQRAMVAAKLANLQRGGDKKSDQSSQKGVLISDAAKALNVSEHSVERAKTVLNHGTKAQVKAIESKDATVTKVASDIQKQKKSEQLPTDKTGFVIPAGVRENWTRAEEIGRELTNAVSRIKCKVESAMDEKKRDVIFAELSNSTIADLANAYRMLTLIVPHAVCPTCQGQAPSTCTLCSGRGFISKFRFDHAVPEELKALRIK